MPLRPSTIEGSAIDGAIKPGQLDAGSVGGLKVFEHGEVPNVLFQEQGAGTKGSRGDGEVSAVEGVVTWKPLTTQGTWMLGDLGVDRVPYASQGGGG